MPTITFDTKSHTELISITREVERLIPNDFKSGICHLFCPHTTAGIILNENADPDVAKDVIYALDKLAPWNDKEYKHSEGNTASHIKSILTGSSLTLPIENGTLELGSWQGIFFCEFDGPRKRRHVKVTFIKDIYND